MRRISKQNKAAACGENEQACDKVLLAYECHECFLHVPPARFAGFQTAGRLHNNYTKPTDEMTTATPMGRLENLWQESYTILTRLRSPARWIDGWTDGRMDGWMDGWMNGWMYGCIDGQTERRTQERTDNHLNCTLGNVSKLVNLSWGDFT